MVFDWIKSERARALPGNGAQQLALWHAKSVYIIMREALGPTVNSA